MKKQLFISKLFTIAFLLFTLFVSNVTFAQKTWDGSANQNWNNNRNWTPSARPTSTDNATIPNIGANSGNVLVNGVSHVCNSLTILGGTVNNTLTIGSGKSLSVTNGVTINAATVDNIHKTLAVNSGTLSCVSIAMASSTSALRNSRLIVSTGTMNVSGNIDLNSTNNFNALTFTSNGLLNIGGTITGGTLTPSTSTVNYNGSGAQNIGAYTYNNLSTSTSGVKTLPAGALINGTLRINGTSTLLYGSNDLVGNSSQIQFNGGTLKTGATTGYSDTVGTLALLDNSNIALGSGNHTLNFANSSGTTWTAGKKLTITGWVGGYNGTAASGTNPKIFVGTLASHLTTAQINQIQFFNGTTYFTAILLSTGELVPTVTTINGIYSFSPTSVCAGSTITITGAGFSGVTAVRVNGVAVASYIVNSANEITATLTTANTTGLITVVAGANTYNSGSNLIVNPKPTSVTATASATSVCNGSSVNLTASAISNSAPGPVTLINENFNTTTNNWTKINNSTGGIPANSAWTLRASGYNNGGSYGTTISSDDDSQFYLSDSDMQGSGTTTQTILQSPAFSTVGLSAASLSFYHYYEYYNGSAVVEVSTNGTIWTTLATYTSNQGAAEDFDQPVLDLSAYVGQSTVYIRFKYNSNWGYYWAIDNVVVSGVYTSAPATYAWTSVPSGFTSSEQNPTGVIPTENTIYTVTATNSYGCSTSASTALVSVNTTTAWSATATNTSWSDAGNWSCGLPFVSSNVTINAGTNQPTIASDVSINSLTIATGASVTLNSTYDLTVTDVIVNNGTFTIQNNANLLQTNNVANTGSGSTNVNRESSALYRLDYTMWSSPVSGSQTLLNFSPLTSITPSSRFYTYDTATNLYASVASPSTKMFDLATGYLIRMPNNWSASTPSSYPGQFTGTPNNGNFSHGLSLAGTPVIGTSGGYGYNAVGNPYPSALNVANFIDGNSANIEGTLWFWRKTNNPLNANSYTTITKAGIVENVNGAVYPTPAFISTGQGFIVKAKTNTLEYNNTMRSNSNVNQFFKEAQKNKYWIELTDAVGVNYGQNLVAYLDGATVGYDNGYDGLFINDTKTTLLTLAGDNEVVIQARPEFDKQDILPLVFKADLAGTYTINLAKVEGVFNNGQDIYVKDKVTGENQILNNGSYTFTSEAGKFTSRFEITYQSVLAVSNPTFNENQVVVYKKNQDLTINSGNIIMDNVKVYDLQGRLLFKKAKVNATELKINTNTVNEVLLVKITSISNEVVTKKVIN